MTARQRKLLEDGPSGEDVLKLEADQKPEDKDGALGCFLDELEPDLSRTRPVEGRFLFGG